MNKIITFSYDIGKRLPLQVLPSPEYPGLHVQLYDPLVLLHAASALHLFLSVAHSSISDRKENSLQLFSPIGSIHDASHVLGWRHLLVLVVPEVCNLYIFSIKVNVEVNIRIKRHVLPSSQV